MLSAFGTARSRRGLTADEVLIFLAAGQLSIVPEDQAQTAKPVTYVSISYLLNIPKETVRRKVLDLIELGAGRVHVPGHHGRGRQQLAVVRKLAPADVAAETGGGQSYCSGAVQVPPGRNGLPAGKPC